MKIIFNAYPTKVVGFIKKKTPPYPSGKISRGKNFNTYNLY